jgi:HEAT repeat protein
LPESTHARVSLYRSRRELLDRIDTEVLELEGSDSQVSFNAARRLADLGSRAATRSLMDVVRRASHDHSKRFALYALRRLRDKRALAMIARILMDRRYSDAVRDEAAEALSVFVEKGSEKALAAFLLCQHDESPAVRYSVAYSLGFSKDVSSRNALRQMLSDDVVPLGGLESVGSMAKESLAGRQEGER